MPLLPLIKPDLPKTEDWVPLLDVSYEANTFSNYGPLVSRLAAEIDADMANSERKALPVANATVGLQVALQAVNRPGTKVITQAFTFPATVNAIISADMVPVFMDVEPDTWFVGADKLDALLEQEDDVGAVMIVRTLGLCCAIREVEAVCARHDVPLIVDSAGCFGGSEQDGRKVGMAGLAEVFSFHATKPFSAGEGGLIYGDTAFVDRCRAATNFGLEGMSLISHGTNAKMSEFAGAISLARRVNFREDVIYPRSARAHEYTKRLAGSNHVKLPAAVGAPTWQFFPIQLASAEMADKVIARLAEAKYAVRGYYRPALHTAPAYRDVARNSDLSISARLAQEIVVLPLHSDVTFNDIATISDVILSACAE